MDYNILFLLNFHAAVYKVTKIDFTGGKIGSEKRIERHNYPPER